MHEKIKNAFDVAKRGFTHFFDKDVPVSYKIIPVAALIYLVYPFDLLSDLVPFFGQADDLTILSLATALFVDIADKKIDLPKRIDTDTSTS